jgi:hypothetical protein
MRKARCIATRRETRGRVPQSAQHAAPLRIGEHSSSARGSRTAEAQSEHLNSKSPITHWQTKLRSGMTVASGLRVFCMVPPWNACSGLTRQDSRMHKIQPQDSRPAATWLHSRRRVGERANAGDAGLTQWGGLRRQRQTPHAAGRPQPHRRLP